MEKYLRLLNPKTTNFDAIPSGGHGALTAADICIAISYAKLTKIQAILFDIHVMDRDSIEQIHSAVSLILPFIHNDSEMIKDEKRNKAAFIALVECFKVSADYKPSERNRALIGGISRMQIQRHLNDFIEFYKKIFMEEIDNAFSKIERNLKNQQNVD